MRFELPFLLGLLTLAAAADKKHWTVKLYEKPNCDKADLISTIESGLEVNDECHNITKTPHKSVKFLTSETTFQLYTSPNCEAGTETGHTSGECSHALSYKVGV
ncbi:hypothetical protein N7492_010608 [Penicillium capsulatum]|uniref:Uncharacterized protein n=1 Tax=Penicillium capsulatum TaxID=69766 RepID=A0A9W9HLH8_9EURO|nr:hypothetical protein N7492_010608 [Penicillium capsulatum]KAJ6113107.1 hypothetical protein N7512_008431 [Penicillium capsulatum]